MHPSVNDQRLWWLAPVAALALVLSGQGDPDVTKVVPPNRNLVNTRDRNVLLDFSVEEGKEKNLLWKAKLGKISYGGPVIAGGKVFVGTNNENPRDPAARGDHGVIMCFDAKTGKFLWQITHKALDNQAQNVPKQGIASTPFVENDRLYYVSNRCELVCADVNGDVQNPQKGKILWSLDMIGDLNVFPCQLPFSSPLVIDDLVYVVTGNGQDVTGQRWRLPSPDAPSFIAVNKKTGKLVWKDSSPGRNIMEGSWASPAHANPRGGMPQVLFPGGDGWLYSFEPKTGKLIWKFDCNPKRAVEHPLRRFSEKSYFFTAPDIWEDRAYIGVGRNPEDGPGVGHLWCIELTKRGDVSPRHDNFNPRDPVNKDSALVWHFGGKVIMKPEKGRDIRFGRSLSTCAIHDGLLYISELDGYFHCIDAHTGRHYWEVDLRANVWSSPYWVDGRVLLGNDDGDLLVFGHGKQPKKLSAVDVGCSIKTPVKVADGVLYILIDSHLYAIARK